ncbi:ATP-binding cassette domain-containing protein [Marispirochaeta sp.]|jgi:NitT/TauT family transport system ATP-binding protein|uniref:ABC transporter ATP-binding protein n=1 Tax=Marispirochaeta sp. TaxID=2038653 RepID=UPI0029C62C02|nr:ATP-binding cassette domain-containing protein [Marispirochaeta sp.]
MIQIRNLDFYYPSGQRVFQGLSHSFEAGKLHVVIGPSGCGKTTLLYLVAGLLSPGRGELLLNREVPRKGREKTAVILQDYGLFPWKTVYQNMALGLRLRSIHRDKEASRIARVLGELGLAGKEKNYPATLSGGEKQRLAVGRSLVLEPDLMLLDEPFSSLDAMTREQLQDYLLSVHRKREMTILLVTHSIEEAAYVSDEIHVMDIRGEISSLRNISFRAGDRKSSDFFKSCVEIRNTLESIAAKTAPGAGG